MSEANVQAKPMNTAELSALVLQLQARIEALEAKQSSKSNESKKEMTDDDARSVLFGDLKDMKHKDAAEKLGLSYGQIYSCRLEFTFKHIHKEMKAKSIKNEWVK
jgi:hypothetical protein